ncbi:MAG TPA: hypothetical protein VGG29_09535 [Caulobacteraceae bacterium]|jgi:hypothetical protein
MTRPIDLAAPPLPLSQLSQSQFEVIRDFLVVMSRRMTKAQMLEISDDLHLVLRRRETRSWDEARQGTAGFD